MSDANLLKPTKMISRMLMNYFIYIGELLEQNRVTQSVRLEIFELLMNYLQESIIIPDMKEERFFTFGGFGNKKRANVKKYINLYKMNMIEIQKTFPDIFVSESIDIMEINRGLSEIANETVNYSPDMPIDLLVLFYNFKALMLTVSFVYRTIEIDSSDAIIQYMTGTILSIASRHIGKHLIDEDLSILLLCDIIVSVKPLSDRMEDFDIIQTELRNFRFQYT